MFANKRGVAFRTVAIIAVVIVVVAAVGTGVWLSMSPGRTIPKTIKIGVPASLSGSIALEGQRLTTLLKALADKINSEEGGVYVKEYDCRIPLELIIIDCESDVSRTVEVATKLCTEYDVVAIILNHPPDYSFPVADVAEKYGVPYVAGNPLQVCIGVGKSRPKYWEYTWWEFFDELDALEAYRSLFKEFRSKLNGMAGLLIVDAADGREWSERIIPVLEETGYTYVFPGLFPPNTQDFTAIIHQFKTSNVELLYANCFAYQLAPFIRQSAVLGFKPKVVIGGKWGNLASEIELIGGGLGNGFIHEMAWWKTYPFPLTDWIVETWPKLTDMDLSAISGYIVTHLLVIKAAIEKAGTLNRADINKAIPQVQVDAPVGPIKFNPETHTAKGLFTMGQWVRTQEGTWDAKIIWAPPGSGIPTEEILFPIPWP